MLRPITTRYAGCKFRSRLEARWAVFLDALGIIWQYEAEGYELPSGRYLPDFRLPRVRCYAEIKGPELSRVEMWQPYELEVAIKADGWSVLVLQGEIPRSADELPGEFFDRLHLTFGGHEGLRNRAVQAGLDCARSAGFEFRAIPELDQARAIVAECYDQFGDIQADAAWAEGWCFVCAGQHNSCPAEELDLAALEREYEVDFDLRDLPVDPDSRLEQLMDDHYERNHDQCETCPGCGCSGSRCSFEFRD